MNAAGRLLAKGVVAFFLAPASLVGFQAFKFQLHVALWYVLRPRSFDMVPPVKPNLNGTFWSKALIWSPLQSPT